jgi:predicted HAD superfamily Cof-like phosphohydrolase
MSTYSGAGVPIYAGQPIKAYKSGEAVPKGLDFATAQVETFHKAFGHPVADVPTAMGLNRRVQRYGYLTEECEEWREAETLEDQVDACIDIIYFALGNLVELGIKQPQRILGIVQQANMAKLGKDGKPIIRESDNKIMKPEGWVAPDEDIRAEIARQIEKALYKKADKE